MPNRQYLLIPLKERGDPHMGGRAADEEGRRIGGERGVLLFILIKRSFKILDVCNSSAVIELIPDSGAESEGLVVPIRVSQGHEQIGSES